MAECRAFLTSEHVSSQEALRLQLTRKEADMIRKCEELENNSYLERQLLLTQLSELKRKDNEREAEKIRMESNISIEKKKLQQEMNMIDARRRELEDREDANMRSVAILRREITLEVTDRFKQQVTKKKNLLKSHVHIIYICPFMFFLPKINLIKSLYIFHFQSIYK